VRRIKTGLIGVGLLGSMRLDDMIERIPEAEVVAICDVDESRVKEKAAAYNIPSYYLDYSEMLRDPQIEAVVISNSTNMHCRTICAAAKEGKHIFCEKPVAVNKEELDEIGSCLSKHSDIKFQIGFTKRYETAHMHIKHAIGNGSIGTPVMVKCVAREAMGPVDEYLQRAASNLGVIFDMAIHDIDLALWYLGCEVESLYAMGGVFGAEEVRRIGDVDNYTIVIKFKNDAMAILDGSRNPDVSQLRQVEVFGTHGVMELKLEGENILNTESVESAVHHKLSGGVNIVYEKFRSAYTNELAAFIHSVPDGGPGEFKDIPLPPGFTDASRALELTIDANRSIFENRLITY